MTSARSSITLVVTWFRPYIFNLFKIAWKANETARTFLHVVPLSTETISPLITALVLVWCPQIASSRRPATGGSKIVDVASSREEVPCIHLGRDPLASSLFAASVARQRPLMLCEGMSTVRPSSISAWTLFWPLITSK